MQIKTIVRYRLTPVKMAIIKKTKNKKKFLKRQKIKSVGEDVEQRELFFLGGALYGFILFFLFYCSGFGHTLK